MITHIAASAQVHESAVVGEGTVIWDFAQVREDASLGRDCIVGRGAYVGTGVSIGDRCKIQNHALVYEPAQLENGVFIGPSVVFTNDTYPRAVTPSGELKEASDWHPVGVIVEEGAAIGASAVCVAPVTLGRWSLVGAGSVVIHDVPAFGLVTGNPARRIAWVGRTGHRLQEAEGGTWRCPETGETFIESGGVLSPQD